MDSTDRPATAMPDHFDRMIGALDGLPDVVFTKATTVRTLIPLVGSSQTFIVQTFRQRETGDTVFLEYIGRDGSMRLVIPPKVAETIARQRDALTDQSRKRGARQAVETRKGGKR